MMKIETIRFPGGRLAEAVHVPQGAPASQIMERMNVPRPRGLICLNGGTAKLDEELAGRLQSLIVEGLARLAVEESVTVLTGGTDAGIFSLFGEGIGKWGNPPAPVVGVVPETLVKWPGGGGGDTDLEPHHTHFVLVEGAEWGDETATMYELCAAWSRACPSIAVFAGGGQITLHEMLANVRQGRKMILLAGSGRSTDAVLDARAGHGSPDPRVQEIAASVGIVPFDLRAEPQSLTSLIRKFLIDPQASSL